MYQKPVLLATGCVDAHGGRAAGVLLQRSKLSPVRLPVRVSLNSTLATDVAFSCTCVAAHPREPHCGPPKALSQRPRFAAPSVGVHQTLLSWERLPGPHSRACTDACVQLRRRPGPRFELPFLVGIASHTHRNPPLGSGGPSSHSLSCRYGSALSRFPRSRPRAPGRRRIAGAARGARRGLHAAARRGRAVRGHTWALRAPRLALPRAGLSKW
jgi:hypothetical protein